MKTFADRAIHFYSNLSIKTVLPAGSEIMNPYENQAVKDIVTAFFTRFFDDQQDRVLLLGINPGRFGAGITGITFTDPIRLEEDCQIPNGFEKRAELSSRFIYDVIIFLWWLPGILSALLPLRRIPAWFCQGW